MTGWLELTSGDLAMLVVICFGAGLVRGFSGFALSALVMAASLSILAPVQLIPILWFLEMSASLLMARGGWRDANRGAALRLVAGNIIGWPLGLWLTTTISVWASKTTVLVIVMALALTQLAKIRLAFLQSNIGTVMTGIVAGVVSGLAHVGGMIVALYALSSQSDARTMRGTLVTFLFVGSFGSLIYQLGFGVMDSLAIKRAIVLILPTVLGVWLGTKLFTPKWQAYYRPFCLCLLVILAVLSLIRHLS